MSHFSDLIKCPQCGYERANFDFNGRNSEKVTVCRRCGFHESWTAKCDEGGNFCGWKHEIDRGLGALCYRPTGQGVFACDCLHSTRELVEAERWFRERLAEGDIEPQNSYLTRWNNETEQVDLVIGEFYESLESDGPAVDDTGTAPR